jgi:hypothetical protein
MGEKRAVVGMYTLCWNFGMRVNEPGDCSTLEEGESFD